MPTAQLLALFSNRETPGPYQNLALGQSYPPNRAQPAPSDWYLPAAADAIDNTRCGFSESPVHKKKCNFLFKSHSAEGAKTQNGGLNVYWKSVHDVWMDANV